MGVAMTRSLRFGSRIGVAAGTALHFSANEGIPKVFDIFGGVLDQKTNTNDE